MYPTKKEIIAAFNQIDTSLYNEQVCNWKEKYYTNKWLNLDVEQKLNALEKLVFALRGDEIEVLKSDHYYYVPSQKLIGIGKNASIISTLHEIGHSIYGSSETLACAFSVKVFSEIFPNEYTKLKWVGHMLVKK